MKKSWWISLCVLLISTNFYFGYRYRSSLAGLALNKIPIRGLEANKYLPLKNSSLTLLIYFSHRSGEKDMRESFYWNKLFKEISQRDLSIIGMIPGNENIGNLREKWDLEFPIGYDDNLLLARSLLISFTPFRMVFDHKGKIFYMSPVSGPSESHEAFYYHMIELLKKSEEAEFQKSWPK